MQRLFLIVALTATANAQWQLQDSHTTASLRGIHAIGNGVAWASGTEGTVLRTTDQGKTWEHCTVPPGAEKLDFRGVQAFDARTAIVMSSGKGDLSRLYKTSDGCKNWKLVLTNPDAEGFWDGLQFAKKVNSTSDKEFGVLLGDPVDGHFVLLLSFDSGEHWKPQVQKTPPPDARGEAVFAASNSSLQVEGLGLRSFVTGGRGGPRLISFYVGPDDTCCRPDPIVVTKRAKPFHWLSKEFQTDRLPVRTSSDSSGAFSFGENPWPQVAVGGDYTKPDGTSQTAWYYARSKPYFGWTVSPHPPHGYRSSVAYDEAGKTWVTVGPNGTDISTDDGHNWRAVRPAPTNSPDEDKNWNALSLPFVVGSKGRIGILRPEALKP